MKTIQIKMTDQLFSQLERHIEIHEKRTGIKLAVSDVIRESVSEKLLKGGK